MEHHHQGTHPSPLRRLWTLLKSERRDLWLVLIYAIGVGILSLATPIAVMAVVNTTALTTLTQQLLVLCLGLLLALMIAAFLRIIQTVVVEYMQQRVFVRVVDDLSYRLPRVDIQALEMEHGPELVNRFFDVLTVQKASAILLLEGITVILQTLIGLILLGSYHQWLLGFDLFLIMAFLVMVILGIGATSTAIEESRAKYSVASWLEELARHPLAFKLAGGPLFARHRADLLTREYLEARKNHFRILMRQFGFALLMQAIASVLLLVVGGYLVIEGQLSLGQLVAAELVVSLMVGTFTKWGKQLESYYDLLAAVVKLGHLMDLPMERGTGEIAPRHPRGSQVKFRGVAFQYELGGQPVFQSFDELIQSGEHIALTGPNGIGKTTLLELLFGLRTPSHGHIEIDGIDLRDLNLESHRQQAALVKGIEIIPGTVLENVRMGRDNISFEDVIQALKDVCLYDNVLELPQGLQTRLGSGGAPLSLGQAERLMLARAIVTRPSLLILDESLDGVDPTIRKALNSILFGKQAPWTLIVVTHNVEIANACDRVINLAEIPGRTDNSPTVIA